MSYEWIHRGVHFDWSKDRVIEEGAKNFRLNSGHEKSQNPDSFLHVLQTVRAHCWLPSKVEAAAKASPHFEKIILAVILSRNFRLDKLEAGESGGRRLHLRVSWLRTSFSLIP